MLYTTSGLMLDDRIPPTKLSEQYNREEVVSNCVLESAGTIHCPSY